VIGLIGGLGAFGLGLATLSGVTWDWDIFPIELIIVIILGLAGGGAAYTIRKRVNMALRSGIVNEVQGQPQWGANTKAPNVSLQVGSKAFLVPGDFARSYQGPSGMRIAWVQVGLPRRQRFQSVFPVYILAVNGAALPKFVTAYVVGSAADGSAIGSSSNPSLGRKA
jgi:hypothetical protein